MVSEAFLRLFVETMGHFGQHIATQQDGSKTLLVGDDRGGEGGVRRGVGRGGVVVGWCDCGDNGSLWAAHRHAAGRQQDFAGEC